MDNWKVVSEHNLPPIGQLVETKIDDHNGARNHARLKRGGRFGNVWFNETGEYYVYYLPTHWRYVL